MSYVSTNTDFIPPEKFEIITQKILNKADFDISGEIIEAVPIEEIIEFDFELELLWENIDFLEDDTSDIYALIFPERNTIILNEAKRKLFEQTIGTLNFTFAHELGHFVLHTSKGKQLNLFEESDSNFLCRAENKYDPVEYQANQFAACLLMPKPLIENVVYELIETNRLNWPSLYNLAGKLEVSITALRLRLEKLELIVVNNKIITPLVGTNEKQIGFEF